MIYVYIQIIIAHEHKHFLQTHLKAGGDGGDAGDRPARHITARHGQLKVTAQQQLRRHVLQLERGKLRQLAADPSEDVVVQVPGLVQVLDVVGDLGRRARLLDKICRKYTNITRNTDEQSAYRKHVVLFLILLTIYCIN